MILKFWGHRAHPWLNDSILRSDFPMEGRDSHCCADSRFSHVKRHRPCSPDPWGCLSWSLLADTSGTRRLWPWCFDLVGQNKNVSRDYRCVFDSGVCRAGLLFILSLQYRHLPQSRRHRSRHNSCPFSHFVRNCGVLLWFLPSCFRRSCLPWLWSGDGHGPKPADCQIHRLAIRPSAGHSPI